MNIVEYILYIRLTFTMELLINVGFFFFFFFCSDKRLHLFLHYAQREEAINRYTTGSDKLPTTHPTPASPPLSCNSVLFYPKTLGGRRGTTNEFATIPFHLDLFSAALVELAKSIPVHSLILSSHLFFCLPLFLFPFTVPCRIVFAKPEDLETWPNHLSFRFLTRVRSSSYSAMAAWIFLRTSSLVTWSLYEMFNSLG